MTTNGKSLHIHLDLVGGIAGDMFVASMLDMGRDKESDLTSSVLEATNYVLPDSAGNAQVYEGLNSGISGLRFKLQKLNHSKSSAHTLDNHSHHDHHHTSYKHLCNRLAGSSLRPALTNIAIQILTIIAKAEAKVHGTSIEDVHFHELADWDSLMDVVASAVILDRYQNTSWSISKLPLGGGLIPTHHGLIPAPAPATAEILKGFEFIDDGIQGERITPTGAAILRYLSDTKLLKSQPQGKLLTCGYGLGTKVLKGMPNILRATLFATQAAKEDQQDTVVIIEFDIDDMTAEELALSIDIIRQHPGVLDLVIQSARGKKNRAVELIRIMVSSADYKSVIEICFLQTSTIGLRYRFETRQYLSRELLQLDGQDCKQVTRPDGTRTLKIEHDQLGSISTLQKRRLQKYKVESQQ